MSTPSHAAVFSFSNALAAWAATAPPLSAAARELLRATASLLTALSEPPAAEPGPPGATSLPTPHSEPPLVIGEPTVPTAAETFAPEPDPAADPQALQELMSRFGNGAVSPKIASHDHARATPQVAAPPSRRPVLAAIARRADIAARACEWAANRNRVLDDGGSFDTCRPGYDALRAECDTVQPLFLWMLDRTTGSITAHEWAVLAGCYRNVSTAAAVINSVAEGRHAELDLIRLFAEAQSALLSALQSHDRRDTIQTDSFQWCRDQAAIQKVYVNYLSHDDAADPSLWAGLASRLESARERVNAARKRESVLKKSLNTINYHVKQIFADAESDHANDWKRIGEALADYFAQDGAPSNPALVDAIEPVADLLPEESVTGSDGIRRVLPYVDARVAARDIPTADTPFDREITAELRAAREVLRGKRIVMIGGEARRPQRETLERELELRELVWISSREHQSIESFIPEVSRTDTALVIVAIRWSSHSFEDVKHTCIEHGKPYVRLPAGYGVNRVAYEIIRQQGESLRRSLS